MSKSEYFVPFLHVLLELSPLTLFKLLWVCAHHSWDGRWLTGCSPSLGTPDSSLREIDLRSLHVTLPQTALPKLWNCHPRLPRLPSQPEFKLPIVPIVPNFGMVLQSFRNEAGNNHILMSPQQDAKPRTSLMHCSVAAPLAICTPNTDWGWGTGSQGKFFKNSLYSQFFNHRNKQHLHRKLQNQFPRPTFILCDQLAQDN